ncbi:MAG: sodium:alanine symporter family protein [Oscillospiraceae bacterium]|nr:sodium:alanine symporter family protein [Oscillospiraceae bacterium]
MLGWLERINESINGIVWGPVTLLLFLSVGVWFTLGTGWLQLSKIGLIFRNTIGSLGKNRGRKDGGISPFQAMSTALAGTMGVGNITGIATAMTLGGAGAIFWMWISAFFGMMTKYAEVLLAVHYRQKGGSGYYGGPMYYMENGVGSKTLAVIFSVLCIIASLGAGNMTQSNAISLAALQLWGLPPWFTGLLVALVIGLVIVGGIRRIAAVTEWMIPFLSLAYLICSVLVLILRADRLPDAFRLIVSSALHPAPAIGGIAGYSVSRAIRFGFARGIFSNEAGLGSAPIAHAAADASHPALQGMWGIFEVFADTLVICTLTALVILTSGTADNGFTGAGMTVAAFSAVLGTWGGKIVSFSLIFYAIAAIIGWSFYGEQSLSYLIPHRKNAAFVYRLLFLFCCFLGAITKLDLVWGIADTLNGLMAAPNLLAILTLSDVVFRTTKELFLPEQRFAFKKPQGDPKAKKV